MLPLSELFKMTEQLQQNCIAQRKQHFRERLSPLLCGVFSLGMLQPVEVLGFTHLLLPKFGGRGGSRTHPLIYAPEGLYTATTVTSQTPQGFWCVMP